MITDSRNLNTLVPYAQSLSLGNLRDDVLSSGYNQTAHDIYRLSLDQFATFINQFALPGSDLQGAKVSAKIVSHLKGDKVIIFKKKRRKGYKKKNGHRQQFTKIEITGITL